MLNIYFQLEWTIQDLRRSPGAGRLPTPPATDPFKEKSIFLFPGSPLGMPGRESSRRVSVERGKPCRGSDEIRRPAQVSAG